MCSSSMRCMRNAFKITPELDILPKQLANTASAKLPAVGSPVRNNHQGVLQSLYKVNNANITLSTVSESVKVRYHPYHVIRYLVRMFCSRRYENGLRRWQCSTRLNQTCFVSWRWTKTRTRDFRKKMYVILCLFISNPCCQNF